MEAFEIAIFVEKTNKKFIKELAWNGGIIKNYFFKPTTLTSINIVNQKQQLKWEHYKNFNRYSLNTISYLFIDFSQRLNYFS